MTTQQAESPPEIDRQVAGYITNLRGVAETRKRSDLAQRLKDESGRLTSLEAALVVTGEAKKGKSSLVNALLGRPGLLPVDADVATNARIVIRHAKSEHARVFRDGVEPEEVPVDDVARWASVAANPNNEKGVQLVEVGLDHRLMRSGLTLVDTPGVGGLNAGHAEITLTALVKADALLFVLDGGSPITEQELAFLRRATDRIATVIFVLTKRDLYAGWEQTLAEDRALLAAYAPQWKNAPFLALSSRAALRAEALRGAGDEAFAERLAAQSGYRELDALLTTRVLPNAKALRQRNILQLARTTIAELAKADIAALAAAEGEPSLQAALKEATEQKDAFVKSKRVGNVALADELTLLGQHLNLEFTRQLQELRERYDRDIKANRLKPESVGEGLDSDLRAVLARLEEALDARSRDIAERLVGGLSIERSLAESNLGLPEGLVRSSSDGSESGGLAQGITALLPSIFPVTGLASAASLLGTTIGVGMALMPLGIAAGLVLVPITLVARRRTREQQEATQLVRTALERARTEMQPVLSETVIKLRQAFQSDLQSHFERRERELAEAVEEQKRLLQGEASKRAEARREAQERIKELETLRQQADELGRMTLASTG